MLKELRTGRKLATTLCLISLATLAALVAARGGRLAQAAPALAMLPRPPEPGGAYRAELNPARFREDASGYVQVLRSGGRIELTLEPRLQHLAEQLLDEAGAPQAAAVLLSVDDGRVLALAGRKDGADDNALALALEPWAPAASIFKLVTAAALVERGVPETARVCYHGGVRSVEATNLLPHPRWDSACATLGFGVAKSQNAIIARLAHDHLRRADLERTAQALGFGAPLPFELAVPPSRATLPRETEALAFARVAAGFWRTTMSPVHGAYLAATLARGGVTPPLRLVDRVVGRSGDAFRPEGAPERRALDEATARAVTRMMVGTTEFGTARHGFYDKRTGQARLPGVKVAGKTGSLNRQAPFVAYSWFVGFAPAERPEVAVAVLLGNGAVYRKRAHQVAADVLAGYFHGAPALKDTAVASR